MSVKAVHNKYLIVYYSVGGNTKGIVDLIKKNLDVEGQECEVLALPSKSVNIETYDHVFIGSPTYGEGITPKPALNFLRYILKDNDFKLPSFSVFGSGDTQWKTYCRAVDEIEYHLGKKTTVSNKLKIEQYPISNAQITKINKFVEESLRR
jgi:flavodoxin I